uniref:Uncharacterized protein n=1 Tax=Anguilla anguilla TaxID=7936 RepID=A0A0E9PGH6_ANGAN
MPCYVLFEIKLFGCSQLPDILSTAQWA